MPIRWIVAYVVNRVPSFAGVVEANTYQDALTAAVAEFGETVGFVCVEMGNPVPYWR